MTLLEQTKNLTKNETVTLLLDIINKNQDTILILRKKCFNQKKELEDLNIRIGTLRGEEIDSQERFFEVKEVDSNKSKITLNPVTGRVTLKISNKSSEAERQKFTQMAKIILESDRDFAPYTYRGEAKHLTKSNTYKVCLQTTSRQFKECFEIKEDE